MQQSINIKKIRYYLLLSLVFLAPMSLHPSVALPILNFPSFRIGLYQLLAVAFVTACIPLIIDNFLTLMKKRGLVVSISLIAITLVVGLTTSLVPVRSALYSASLVALLILGLCGYLVRQELSKKNIKSIWSKLLWSGIVFGILAILQLIIASFDRMAFGTLCATCTDVVFGFPRINLFAAEPQFFANSLLPAFFASLFFRSSRRLANWTLFFSSLAIGLTFSRGALVAISLALLTYAAVISYKKQWPEVIRVIKLAGVYFVFTLVAFGLLIASASWRYRETPYIAFNTMVSMLDHLTLGRVHVPQKQLDTPKDPQPSTEQIPSRTIQNDTVFIPEGFVEASSGDRIDASKLAFDAWNDTPITVVFGVGIGNVGAYINQHIQQVPLTFSVYMFYILVLSEMGLIGLMCLLTAITATLRLGFWSIKTTRGAFIFTLTLAFAVQFAFLGSYINVIYIYLITGMFLIATNPNRYHHVIDTASSAQAGKKRLHANKAKKLTNKALS